MMKQVVRAVALCTNLVASASWAQATPPSASRPMPSAGDSTFGAVEPLRMSTFLTQVQSGQWQVSNLEGLEVYNSNNEKIGDISGLVLDTGGTIQAVVIGVGGILGVGAREVAFPFEQIRFVNDPRAGTTGSTTGEASLSGSPGGGTVPSPAAAGTAAAPPVNSNVATNNADAASPSAPGGNGGSNPDQQTASTGRRAVPNHAVLMVPMTKEQLQEMPEFQQP